MLLTSISHLGPLMFVPLFASRLWLAEGESSRMQTLFEVVLEPVLAEAVATTVMLRELTPASGPKSGKIVGML